MRTRTLIAAAIMLALVAAACGGAGSNSTSPGGAGTPTTAAISHPTGADEVILSEAMGGGFVPVEYNLQAMPGFTLYGDGRVLTQGPVIEIYPPPALPNIQQQTVTEEGIQTILETAQEAGLLDGDHEYTGMTQYVTDVGTTTFTVNANDTENVTSIYAMGFASNNPDGQGDFDIPQEEIDADDALAEFSAKLAYLQPWLPDGSVSESTEYEPTELRIFVRDYGKADPNLEQQPVDWPLDTPLSSFGAIPTVSVGGLEYRCGTVEGTDLATLWPMAAGTNTETPWVSDGKQYRLTFRPLLPNETGC